MKGIAAVPLTATDDDLLDLKGRGIVGLRLNLYSFDVDVFAKSEINEFLRQCVAHDHHVEVFATSPLRPKIAGKLRESGARLIIEHMGWPDVSKGIGQPCAFRIVRRSTSKAVNTSERAVMSDETHTSRSDEGPARRCEGH